jgi:hypothetical protein
MLLLSFIRISSYASASTCVTEYGRFLCKIKQNLHNCTILIKSTQGVTVAHVYEIETMNITMPNVFLPARFEDLSGVAKNSFKSCGNFYAISTGKQIGQLLISQLCVSQ